MTYTASAP
jgi:hypothetical protein